MQLDPKSTLIEGIFSSSLAYILAKQPFDQILVIASHVDEAFLADLAFFAKKWSILDFPSWETLPDEKIAPSPDIVGKRLDVLSTLKATKVPTIVCTSLQGALQKVPSDLPIIDCKLSEEIGFDNLIEKLKNFGYVQRPIVADKGQFAVRGGIIDVFPVHALAPHRIEFFRRPSRRDPHI